MSHISGNKHYIEDDEIEHTKKQKVGADNESCLINSLSENFEMSHISGNKHYPEDNAESMKNYLEEDVIKQVKNQKTVNGEYKLVTKRVIQINVYKFMCTSQQSEFIQRVRTKSNDFSGRVRATIVSTGNCIGSYVRPYMGKPGFFNKQRINMTINSKKAMVTLYKSGILLLHICKNKDDAKEAIEILIGQKINDNEVITLMEKLVELPN
jgi:ArsR family metal-binding transcriptional regulator